MTQAPMIMKLVTVNTTFSSLWSAEFVIGLWTLCWCGPWPGLDWALHCCLQANTRLSLVSWASLSALIGWGLGLTGPGWPASDWSHAASDRRRPTELLDKFHCTSIIWGGWRITYHIYLVFSISVSRLYGFELINNYNKNSKIFTSLWLTITSI